jgi:hypothetical protein
MSIITQREEDLLELNAEEVFNEQWDELVKAYLGERLVQNGNSGIGGEEQNNYGQENNGNGPNI